MLRGSGEGIRLGSARRPPGQGRFWHQWKCVALVESDLCQAQGDVPVMDSLGVLFQHAAFFARIARTTGAGKAVSLLAERALNLCLPHKY